LTNVSINELCTRIRTRRICVGVAVVFVFVVVVGRVVVMSEIVSFMSVADDGMTRDDDQAVPELLC
jgi:hypothetical protein